MYTYIAKQYVCKCSRTIKNRKQFMDTKKALLLYISICIHTCNIYLCINVYTYV